MPTVQNFYANIYKYKNLVEDLSHHIEELLVDLNGAIIAPAGFDLLGKPQGVTTYTVYVIFVLLLVLAIVLLVARKVSLRPTKGPVAAIEATVDYINNEVGTGVLGSKELVKQHMPFLMTLFFFILVANLVGLIPGAKAATGTFSLALVLALVSFIYFNYYGIKHSGIIKYLKNLAPAGITPGVNILVWLIELMSLILRLFTLSVRLFANMFAGHIIIGAFSLLTTLFVFPLINDFAVANIAGSLPALGWMLLLVVMYAMELLVAFIQAYVFTLLSAVYIQMAVSEH